MLNGGLVSISFREIDVEGIIKMTKEMNLKGVEWGADLHLPVKDIEKAVKVKRLMDENDLQTSAYGTYYRVGEENNEKIEDILKIAKILGTKVVRVWGGRKDYRKYTKQEKKIFISDLKRIANIANSQDIDISFEYHWDTMTHSLSGVKFILENTKELNNIKFHWQPATFKQREELIGELEYLIKKSKLLNIHVYHWEGEKPSRKMLNLSEGAHIWKEYFEILKRYNQTTWVSLEHIKDNSIENYRRDAKTLNELIKEVEGNS